MANQLFSAKSKSPTLPSSRNVSEENMSISSIDGSLDHPDNIKLLTDIVPIEEKSEDVEIIRKSGNSDLGVDFGEVLAGAVGGESASATDVIKSLVTVDDVADLPVKGIIANPSAFAACEIIADYNDKLGLDEVGDMLRSLTVWRAKYGCGEKGRRASEAFKALAGEKEKEFQLEKELKGVAGK